MRLWHDDVRPAPPGWVWARTNAAAMDYLRTGEVEEASLDHDLGFHDVEIPDDPDALMEVLVLKGRSAETGLHLVRWMIDNECVPPRVTIHSWNPDGARYMAAALNRYAPECLVIISPFQAVSG